MNSLIEAVGGRTYSLVYVGYHCLLWFPSNQQAWEFLREFFLTNTEELVSPIYLVLAIDVSDEEAHIPQIAQVVLNEEKDDIKMIELYGQDFDLFQGIVVSNWSYIRGAIHAR